MSIIQYTRVAAVCLSLACMQATIASETPATQAHHKETTMLNVNNKTDFGLRVISLGVPTGLPAGQSRTVPLTSEPVVLQPAVNSDGKILKITLQKKAEEGSSGCEVDQCIAIEGTEQK